MKEKILIVEDEEVVQKTVARVLRQRPYDVLSAYNGREALELVGTHNPDLILLDIEMPVKSGLDVLRELRQNHQTRMIPVIMLTGHRTIDDEVNGLDMGADDYITKPFALEELLARVQSVLRRNRQDLSANPLTRLPGSPMIEEEVNRRIQERIPFAFFYIDIDYFKSFNDAYGFAEGDKVIRETAAIIVNSLKSAGGPDHFAGHIGGDDFVAICDPQDAPHVGQRIVSEFDEKAPNFYTPADRALGYIQTKNRLGHWQAFPLITLSVGIVTSEHRRLDHYGKVVQIASEMKAYFKSQPEPLNHLSRFAFDRRRDS